MDKENRPITIIGYKKEIANAAKIYISEYFQLLIYRLY